jgi:hypothetical protein
MVQGEKTDCQQSDSQYGEKIARVRESDYTSHLGIGLCPESILAFLMSRCGKSRVVPFRSPSCS